MNRALAAMAVAAALLVAGCGEEFTTNTDGTVLVVDNDGNVDRNNIRDACPQTTVARFEWLPGPNGKAAKVWCK